MIRRSNKSNQLNPLPKWRPAKDGDVFDPIMPDSEVWIWFGNAVEILIARRRTKLEAALSDLRQACQSGRVAWRHQPPKVDEKGRLLMRRTAPDMLTVWSYEMKRETIHPLEAQVEVRESDLSLWPVKPRRGPERGAVARFADGDRRLFEEIERIMREESKSLTEAVRDLDCEGKVKGRGTPESRVRRVTRRYLEERLTRSLKTRSH